MLEHKILCQIWHFHGEQGVKHTSHFTYYGKGKDKQNGQYIVTLPPQKKSPKGSKTDCNLGRKM